MKINLRLLALTIVAAVIIMATAHSVSDGRYRPELYEPMMSLPLDTVVDRGVASSDVDSMIAYLSVAQRRIESDSGTRHDNLYARALNGLGYAYLFGYSDFPRSYSYLLHARDVAEASRDTLIMGVVDLNLACLNADIDNTDESLRHYRMALDELRRVGSWENYTSAMIGMIFQSFMEDRHEDVIFAVRNFETSGIPENVRMYRYASSLAQCMRRLEAGDHGKAIEIILDASGHIDTRLTPRRYRLVSVYTAAKIYERNGDIDSALSLIDSERSAMNEEENNVADEIVSGMLLRAGRKDEADRMRLRYYDNAEKLGLLSRQHDIDKVKNAYDADCMQDHIDDMIASGRARTRLLWFALAIIIVISAVCWYVIRLNIKLKRAKEVLYLKNQELLGNAQTSPQVLSEDTAQPEENGEQNADGSGNAYAEVPDENLQEFACKISETVKDNDEVFMLDFNVIKLGMLMGEHPRKVSKAINLCMGMTFSQWLLKLRVDEACRRLSDIDRYGNLTISAISESLGFRSRTHFADVFKKQTGLPPSEYQRIARQKACR